jgi:cytochrome c6
LKGDLVMRQRWHYVVTIVVSLSIWGLMALTGNAAIVQAAELPATPSTTSLTSLGTTVFTQNCAACHAGGGNIVRRGKTLKLKALQRNQMDSEAAIAAIVTQGKGNMSAYGEKLTPEEIAAVSAYVLEQATANWP